MATISYGDVALAMLIILALIAVVVWGLPWLTRERPDHGNKSGFVLAIRNEPTDSRAPKKERYGEPPGGIRAVHHNELGYRGWSDNPGDYEGSSASALSAYVDRSA